MISLILASILLNSVPEISPEVPASYSINAVLNDSVKTISGTENVTFINPTSKSLNHIAFHLYPNALKDTSTVYCREDERTRRRVARGNTARLDVSNIRIFDNQTADSNISINGTRLYIGLDRPLPPGRKIEISMDFEILIPKMIGHFGYDSDGAYLIAHCFPILCGYQDGRLIDWEYHANSEFFSNFSYYDVTIELPSDFEAVSTGNIVKTEENDTTIVWHARADTVIDFAAACGPGFEIIESDFNDISLKYLIKKKHGNLFSPADSTVKWSLDFCGKKLFQYPYKVFSVADIDYGRGALELPGLIITGFSGQKVETGNMFLKKAIAHETAHQWYYATLATNEFEEAWLDESFASYTEIAISKEHGFKDFPFIFSNYLNDDESIQRFFALAGGSPYPINLKSWEYPDFNYYMSAVYGRGWMVLQALKNVAGEADFDLAMKAYAERYRFKHPTQPDFMKVFTEITGLDLSEFEEMFINGTARVDYSVESVIIQEENIESEGESKSYQIEIKLERKLDGILPQIVTVILENDTAVEKYWDGREKIKTINLEVTSKPISVSIDHRLSYDLDENKNNNSYYLDGHVSRLISMEWDFLFILEFLAALIL